MIFSIVTCIDLQACRNCLGLPCLFTGSWPKCWIILWAMLMTRLIRSDCMRPWKPSSIFFVSLCSLGSSIWGGYRLLFALRNSLQEGLIELVLHLTMQMKKQQQKKKKKDTFEITWTNTWGYWTSIWNLAKPIKLRALFKDIFDTVNLSTVQPVYGIIRLHASICSIFIAQCLDRWIDRQTLVVL